MPRLGLTYHGTQVVVWEQLEETEQSGMSWFGYLRASGGQGEALGRRQRLELGGASSSKGEKPGVPRTSGS